MEKKESTKEEMKSELKNLKKEIWGNDKFDTTASTFVEETRKSNTSSATVYKLITPKVIAAAREHFGCSTINGVYLENEGDSGSAGAHFEKVHYGNELMTAQDVRIPAFSKIGLAFLLAEPNAIS